jgi:Tfp pilus assembly protein PilV
MPIMKRMVNLSQRGDTIVEVLVAIAVASLILGGAYVTSQNSLSATQDSQEHADALQIAQGEVEWLRVDSTQQSLFSQPNGFCIVDALTTSPAPAAGTVKTGSYCKVDSSGAHNTTTNLDIYKVSISSQSNANGSVTFTVKVNWPGLQNVTDQVQLLYRIYP